MSCFVPALVRPGSAARFSLLRAHSIAHARISTSRKTVAECLEWKPENAVSDVTVDGFIRSIRAQKRHQFVVVGDGSTIHPLQAVVPVDQAEGLSVGAAVQLHGSWVPSQGRGQSHELQVQHAEILGPCDASTFPLQKKYQTPEYLRAMPHMRPRIPFNAALLRFRSELIASFNHFFTERSFAQTHTPILTSSDCEGAGEVFNVSVLDGKPESPEGAAGESTRQFFRRPVHLTVSAQLHLEALAQAVGDVWTLSPTFRAEQSDTPRHLSEFYMLEAEMSFADSLGTVMDTVEDMLRHVATHVASSKVAKELLTRTQEGSSDMASAELVQQRWNGMMSPSWPRITYTEAINLLKNSSKEFANPVSWGVDLSTEHERYLASSVSDGKTPVFITQYPKEIKAFYMMETFDASEKLTPGRTVECFDLLVPDFCEIVGGSMREHRLAELLNTMDERQMGNTSRTTGSVGDASDLNQNDLDWYLDLRRWGCPPHGGFGLGFDRLICYLSGIQTIRDTSAFPRWYGRCDS